MKNSLFIAISPSHILNFEELIKCELHAGKAILINPGDFHFDSHKWDIVVCGGLDLIYKYSSPMKKIWFQLKKLILYKKYVTSVYTKIDVRADYDFYYCNLEDVLTNHLYQELIKNHYNKFIVVEDGVLNYYHPVQNLKLLKRKKLLSTIFGLNFKIYMGHPTNIESKEVAMQYVRLPTKAISPSKSFTLPYKNIEYQAKEQVLLVIGQDIMHNTTLGEEYYIQRVEKLFLSILELEGENKKVIYKPHRNGNIDLAKKALSKIFPNSEVLMDITPIEELVELIAPGAIYSFESSAMLNLKLSLKNNLVRMGILPFYQQDTGLLPLYKELGIQILK